MEEKFPRQLSIFLLILLLKCLPCNGLNSDTFSDAAVGSLLSYHNLLIAAAVVICVVVLVLGCADLRALCANLCPSQSTFRDFDEDGYFNDISIAAAPSVQFPMYPPVESTPETRYSMSSVYFEPLPNIVARHRNTVSMNSNASQLRPKVSRIGLSRSDSEDETLSEQPYNSSQELVTLEKLINNSRNQFPRSQLQYIKELGSGWFGKVLEGEGQGILPGHKKTRVVVQMLKEDSDQHEKLIFLQEGLPYKEIQDPNVIKLFCHCVETSPFLMVLEYCPVDLKSYMRNHRAAFETFDKEHLILSFACDMARGLQAMHQHNYVHRDFALRTCLVTGDRMVKVGDYGLSEELFKEDYYYDNNGDGIPIRWLGPEVISFTDNDVLLKKITRDSNLWSYGVALWELVKFGSLPYTDLSNDNVLRLVVRERTVTLSKPDVPISNLDKLYQLMQKCWLEPTQRPSIRELLIMLLHLQTQKANTDVSDFDQKWNQLLPRQAFDNLHRQNPYANTDSSSINDQNYAQSISNGTITTIAYSDGSDISCFPEVVIRPTSFGSQFSELNASLLAEAGSLQTSLRSVSGTPDSPPTMIKDLKSPVNELSLAAELDVGEVMSEEEESDREDATTTDEPVSSSNNNKHIGNPSQSIGNTNSGFVEEKQGNKVGTIQLQAEVHKTDSEGDRLGHTLGNINQSFSLDFLSEDEDGTNQSLSNRTNIEDDSLRMSSMKDAELFSNNESRLHENSHDQEELFKEFVTSTPKVPDRETGKSMTPVSEFMPAYTSSSEQSSIIAFEDHSFMQPQKYTAYLQTVTTTMEGDDTDFGSEKLRAAGTDVEYLGLDAGFGDNLFQKLETENKTIPADNPDHLKSDGTSSSMPGDLV